MSEVTNIKWVTIGGEDRPEYVEVTLLSGRKVRYYPK